MVVITAHPDLHHKILRFIHLFAKVKGFLGSSEGIASAYNAGDLGSIPGAKVKIFGRKLNIC